MIGGSRVLFDSFRFVIGCLVAGYVRADAYSECRRAFVAVVGEWFGRYLVQ